MLTITHPIEKLWTPGMIIIVVTVILVTFISLYIIGSKLISQHRLRSRASKETIMEVEPDDSLSDEMDEAETAAIAAAIHLYCEELHDVENAVLTINKVSRTYSPWSSKIHGLNTYFNRR